MKLKKVILVILLALIVGIAIASKTYASTSMELGIVSLREGGYGYSANTKNIWKIVEYQNGKYNYNNAIYCLRGGPGFGNSSYIENRTYNVSYNLKEYSTIPNSIKGILPSDEEQTYTSDGQTYTYTNYNAVLILLDNLYLPKDANATSFKQQLINAVFPTLAPEDFVLTDDDIEVVQQCALWYFTNSDPNNVEQYAYHFETLPELQLTQTEGGQGPFDKTLDDVDSTWARQTQASQLYDFLISSAKKFAGSYGDGDIRGVDTAPAEVVDTDVTSEIVNDKIIAGPFRVEDYGNTNYDVLAEVKDQDDNTLDFTILDENKQVVSSDVTLKDLVNKDFYIAVSDDANISKVKVNINIKYLVTVPTFYTVGGSELVEQPVVLVTRTEKEEPKEVEVPVIRKQKEFDLALKKFITKVNSQNITNRVPQVDVTPLDNGGTNATYEQSKIPATVTTGDIVTYTIRIYNEGEIDGYANEIADYIPEGLGFIVGNKVNEDNMWKIPEENLNVVKLSSIPNAVNNLTASDFSNVTSLDNVDVVVGNAKITTDVLKYSENSTENLIKAFDKDSGVLSYKDVQVTCVVVAQSGDNKDLQNIAEITSNSDENGADVVDRDSTPDNVDVNKYPASTNVEDDDDFENLVLKDVEKDFDLALRKFITNVDGTEITSRLPIPVIDSKTGDITYNQPKNIVDVKNGSIVTYTIRVFNEGAVDGYAKEIKDVLPQGLDFLPDNEINKQYGWTVSEEDNRTITTTYLSKESDDKNLIKAFNVSTMNGPDYKDVKVVCVVNLPDNSNKVLTNTAEIKDDSDKDGNPIKDKDSTPNNGVPGEDDMDFENVQIVVFDLALKKFITNVNGIENLDRAPEFVDDNGVYTYKQLKEPVFVQNNDIVVYTIRVFNEGNIPGFAEEVKDDVPAGLIFIPDNEINREYRWHLDENGNIRSDYLSKEQSTENAIPAFDKETMDSPAYKDVKVAFKVDESAIPKDNRIVINTAEISKDYNEANVPDIDSTPDNGVPGEDDIDKEYIKVGYFDLALLKWVSSAYVIVDGKTTTIQGNSTSNKPGQDPVLKVDVDKKKISTTDIIFVYTIQVMNQGEIAGYAKEVKDRIPAGLEFVPSDNPSWHLDADGNAVTEQLADTLLQPGDTSSVQISLRWTKSDSNFGLKTNVAEISKDYNDSNTPDIDSTPDNNVPTEDDQDEASVIISIKTGDMPMYLGLISASIATLGGGIYFIRRFVL